MRTDGACTRDRARVRDEALMSSSDGLPRAWNPTCRRIRAGCLSYDKDSRSHDHGLSLPGQLPDEPTKITATVSPQPPYEVRTPHAERSPPHIKTKNLKSRRLQCGLRHVNMDIAEQADPSSSAESAWRRGLGDASPLDDDDSCSWRRSHG